MDATLSAMGQRLITSAQWTPGKKAILATIDGVDSHIPDDPTNADRQAIARWEAEGHIIAAPPAAKAEQISKAILALCDQIITAVFCPDGFSVRSSMNTWAATVALSMSRGATIAEADMICADMVPKLNAWEGAMFVERDRVIAAGLPPNAAQWPALPEGATDFILLCGQG